MSSRLLQSSQQPASAVVNLPGSKSLTNRALLLAALAKGESVLQGYLLSDDSRAFMTALQSLGVKLEEKVDGLHVYGNGLLQSSDKVWCQDAGTAARFLLAACAAFPGKYRLDGTKRLRERPLQTLIAALRQQGANIDADALPCTVNGTQLKGGEIALDARDSTQFISALLMIAPFMQASVTVIAENLNRQAYIDITTQIMQQFGVNVKSEANHFHVALPQTYQARHYLIEADLSTASYFFAAAALTNGKVTVKNINRAQCLQGDIRFLDALEQMGCSITAEVDQVTIQGCQQLKGIEINMQDFSDPFMTLAAIAPYADTPTTIQGLAHTRLQESDRVSAIASELTKCGVKVETGYDWIRIHPSKTQPVMVLSHNDHRVAMSLAIFALRTPGIVLQQPECVAKTCPDFFTRLAELFVNQ